MVEVVDFLGGEPFERHDLPLVGEVFAEPPYGCVAVFVADILQPDDEVVELGDTASELAWAEPERQDSDELLGAP